MKVLGWIVAIVGIFVLSPIWSGYVLSVLWGWFFVPAFHLPQISIALAIGISLVVHMFTYSGSDQSSSKSKDKSASAVFIQALSYSFFSPLVALGLGAIVHAFV